MITEKSCKIKINIRDILAKMEINLTINGKPFTGNRINHLKIESKQCKKLLVSVISNDVEVFTCSSGLPRYHREFSNI